MKTANEVLLTLAYVSQISDPDAAKKRFFESLNGFDERVSFEDLDRLPDGIAERLVFPIATIRSSFGYAVMSEDSLIAEDEQAVFRNAFQFLAVLLENRTQAKSLAAHNTSLHRQAEAALSANDALLRIAGETAKFGGWSVDLSTDICFWSDKVADIHDMPRGYAPAVKDAISYYAPEWREKITKVFMDCAENGIPFDEEMEILTSTGKRVWVRSTGEAVRNENGEIVKVQGSFQDITEGKQIADTLKKSEKKFRNLFENSTVGKSLTTLDGHIDVNKTFCKIIGYSKEELEEMKWTGITHPDDLQVSNNVIQSLLEDRISSGRFEKRYFHKDGHVVWVDVSTYLQRDQKGEPQYFITSVIDISDRKQLENELRESQAILQSAMDNSAAGIAIADAPDGRLRYVNNAGLLIRGGDRQSIVDGIGIEKYVESWQLLDLDGRFLERDEVPLARAILFGETSSREFIVRRDQNDDRIVLGNAAPIKDAAGNVTAAIVVFNDITESKRAEQELRTLKDDLENEVKSKTRELQERVAALERFHDATIEREFRMKELRDEIEELKHGKSSGE